MSVAGEPRADLPALTGIRGLAAWFVVLFHIRGAVATQLPSEAIAIFAKGYLAVDLFFMLSGFVLWLNYSDRVRQGGLAAAPLFLARRIARIWPLHLFMLGIAVTLALTLEFAGKPAPMDYPWGELPLHILLLQNWGFTGDLAWNDPAWSISCEWAAYLLFPLLAVTVDWRRYPAGALVAVIASLAWLLHSVMAAHGATTLGSGITRFGVLRCLTEFATGTILCALWQRWQEQARPFKISLALTVALAALCVWLPETLIVPPLFAALLLTIALGGGNRIDPLAWPPLRYLGTISYATYLSHFLLFRIFKLLLVDDPANVPLLLIGLYLALTMAASILLYHGLECPAQNRLNRHFAGWLARGRRVAAPERRGEQIF